MIQQTECFEARNYKSLKWKSIAALIICIVSSAGHIYQIFSQSFWMPFNQSHLIIFPSLVLFIIAIVYYSKSIYYDRFVQLKIDKDGIWTPRTGMWNWQDIWYFSSSDESNGKSRINFLEIKLKDGVNDKKNSLIIPIDDYDKPKEEIRSLMEKYAALYGVRDLGDNTLK